MALFFGMAYMPKENFCLMLIESKNGMTVSAFLKNRFGYNLVLTPVKSVPCTGKSFDHYVYEHAPF